MIGLVLGMVVMVALGLGSSMCEGLGEGKCASGRAGDTGDENLDEIDVRGLGGASSSLSISTSTSVAREGVFDAREVARGPLTIRTSVGHNSVRPD